MLPSFLIGHGQYLQIILSLDILTSGFCAKNSCRESGSVSNTSPSTCTHIKLLKIPHVYLALLKITSSSHLARTKGPRQISHTTGPETFIILLPYYFLILRLTLFYTPHG
jgi:hypothetical protein